MITHKSGLTSLAKTAEVEDALQIPMLKCK